MSQMFCSDDRCYAAIDRCYAQAAHSQVHTQVNTRYVSACCYVRSAQCYVRSAQCVAAQRKAQQHALNRAPRPASAAWQDSAAARSVSNSRPPCAASVPAIA
eukprot:2275993-Rhodomonas_salina.1